jgi:hypothetical protein
MPLRSEDTISEFDFAIVDQEKQVFSFNGSKKRYKKYEKADSEGGDRYNRMNTFMAENRGSSKDIQTSDKEKYHKDPQKNLTAF